MTKSGQVSDNESDDVFEVEYISEEKTKKGNKYYLIKWKGYPVSENTWEIEDNINDKSLIDDFLAKKKKREKKSDKKRTAGTGQSASKIKKRQSIRSPLDGVSVKRTVSPSASPSSKSKASGKRVEPKKNEVILESSDEGENKIASESNASPKSVKKAQKKNSSPGISNGNDSAIPSTDLILSQSSPAKRSRPTREVIGEDFNLESYDHESSLSTRVLNLPDWTGLIKRIDHIQKTPAGIKIYVKWKDGKKTEHSSTTMHKKGPELLLDFYEQHLSAIE